VLHHHGDGDVDQGEKDKKRHEVKDKAKKLCVPLDDGKKFGAPSQVRCCARFPGRFGVALWWEIYARQKRQKQSNCTV
jgi:hypothetical protein